MEYLTQLKILQSLRSIESRLDKIENLIKENSRSSKKMEEHIEFIDGIYDVVKKPVSNLLSFCNNKTIELQDKSLLKNELIE